MLFLNNKFLKIFSNRNFHNVLNISIRLVRQTREEERQWYFLEHKGPLFAPAYELLPNDVKFYYNGKEMKLSQDAEEMATFYAKLIDHEYTSNEIFNRNFFSDWCALMTSKERELIKDLSKCNFTHIHQYFIQKSEEKKAMSKEEKQKIKAQNEQVIEEYGYCMVDGIRERIANFKIEPPGLFRGRGKHPKMGMLKKRIQPEDVTINCSVDSKIPEPPNGHRWKEVKHDDTVTWLACWKENISNKIKYVLLNQTSKLLYEKDHEKYELARKLVKRVKKIRKNYEADMKADDLKIRQRAVALYFIDKLALRVGNEKNEDEADTVGCCSLRVEHVRFHENWDGKKWVVIFDFLGKDSIPYHNEVCVDELVFKNLQSFCRGKKSTDDLFDKLNTYSLNKYLQTLMPNLTTKVFRTYNASITLQKQLQKITKNETTISEKLLQYNRANRTVAILCNHQRSVPKSHEKSIDNLKVKIVDKKEQIVKAEKELKEVKRNIENGSSKSKRSLEIKQNKVKRLKDQLKKLQHKEVDKEENKTIALGTSKLNYLDPRISVSWCRKHNVPLEKIYNKMQRSKFQWAIDSTTSEFKF